MNTHILAAVKSGEDGAAPRAVHHGDQSSGPPNASKALYRTTPSPWTECPSTAARRCWCSSISLIRASWPSSLVTRGWSAA